MAFKLLDRVRFAVGNTPGTGSITVGLATTGYQLPAAAGAANGDTFSYCVVDGANWEYGVATYSSTGPSITRTVTQSSAGGTTALTLTGNAIVTGTVRAEDVGTALANLTDVDITSPSNGQTLVYNSSAGKWENGAGGGGLPETWGKLTFTNTTTIFGLTCYVSDQTFTVAANEVFEVEGYGYKVSGNNCVLAFAEDGAHGYLIYSGGDGAERLNYYVSTYSSLDSGGTSQWTGLNKLCLSASVNGSSNNGVYGEVNGWHSATHGDTNINLVGTVTVYIVTDDITKCAFKARVVTPSVYG